MGPEKPPKSSKPKTPVGKGMAMNEMRLRDFRSDGSPFKWTSSEDGPEGHGPCPWCEGDNRFVVWPEHEGGKGGRYWCRVCDRCGDGIDFLRERHGMSFADACAFLDVPLSTLPVKNGHQAQAGWMPRACREVPALWREQAARFVDECATGLVKGMPGYDYVQGRGFTLETIRLLELGWNPVLRHEDRAAWGLPSEALDGFKSFMTMPSGLVIPLRRKAGISGIKIRCADRPNGRAPDHKYHCVSGSVPMMSLPSRNTRSVIIVESELDAVLIWQEARDLTAALALGSAAARPDAAVWAFLDRVEKVCVALDNDTTGREHHAWWRQNRPTARIVSFPQDCKDVGDLLRGNRVRTWVEAALAEPVGDLAALPQERVMVTAENVHTMPEPVRKVWAAFG